MVFTAGGDGHAEPQNAGSSIMQCTRVARKETRERDWLKGLDHEPHWPKFVWISFELVGFVTRVVAGGGPSVLNK